MTSKPPFTPKALGEIAIRCKDPETMAQFYQNVIGLTRLSGEHNAKIIFLKIADGYRGHTSVLALFHHDVSARPGLHPTDDMPPRTGGQSSLHHIALSMDFDQQDAVMEWYESRNQAYRVEHFSWIGWRGIFTEDPEGNTVELVAYDPSLLAHVDG